MGTRGLMAFTRNGVLKSMYNHYDSYPSGLGDNLVKWFTTADLDEARAKFDLLEPVDKEIPPTDAQKEALIRYANMHVATQRIDDWYVILHGTQGDPEKALDAGFYVNGNDFAHDSLWCEWGYVIDLDMETLEVYRGFQKTPVSKGLFASDKANHGGYYPIRPVAKFTLEELKENPNIMNDLENTFYEEEENDDEDY